MTSAVNVRPARASDLGALGRLGVLLVAEHHQFDRTRFLAPDEVTAEAYGRFLVSQARRKDTVVLVAEQDGAVLGYVFGALEGPDFMVLRGPAGAIYDLIVDRKHRGAGIGRTLLEAGVAALAELGAPQVVLFTADKNSGAQRLFERTGFRRTMIEMTRDLEDTNEPAGE